MKPTWIKFCGFTRVEDVEFACDLQIDALGFIFSADSVRNLTIDKAQDLLQHVKGSIKKVAVVKNPTKELMQQIMRLPFDLLQFSGEESAEFCRFWQIPYCKVFCVSNQIITNEIAKIYFDAQAFLLDSHQPGSGKTFDWSLWPKNLNQTLILAGGLNPNNVRDAILKTHADGVDVASGIEFAPGQKSKDLMQAFIQEVRHVQW